MLSVAKTWQRSGKTAALNQLNGVIARIRNISSSGGQLDQIRAAIQQDCENKGPCKSTETFIGVVGDGWSVCAVTHAVSQSKARKVDILKTIQIAIAQDYIYEDTEQFDENGRFRVVFAAQNHRAASWDAIISEVYSPKIILAVTSMSITDRNFHHRIDNEIWLEVEGNEFK